MSIDVLIIALFVLSAVSLIVNCVLAGVLDTMQYREKQRKKEVDKTNAANLEKWQKQRERAEMKEEILDAMRAELHQAKLEECYKINKNNF